jgi:hypothetical protein
MVNAKKTKAARVIEKLNEKDKNAAFGYSSEFLSTRTSQRKDNPVNDDLITSLSEAHETRRTCQVNEWERLGRLYMQRAA